MTPTPNYPSAILSNFDGDLRGAYDRLATQYLALQRQFAEATESRFVEIGRFEADDPVYVHKITEGEISRAVDMADCQDAGVMRNWFYVGDTGELLPVTIGEQERSGGEFYYATADIIAGGRSVGTVTYTDH